ncbi:TPA: YdcF family protein [Listeria monocytogenes]|nr:YdcF family protein [Listeria monocytogenes]
MISALLATACIWAARRMWAEEPRRLRIAALALVGAWFGFWALLEISAYLGVPAALVLPLGALLLPFSVVALAVILIRNGMHMLTREGRSLGNSLSLLAGLALIIAPVAAVVLVATAHPVGVGAAVLIFLGATVLGSQFLVFYVFARLYEHRAPRPDPAGVVVLGSGLIDGRVPPLLASRLDRGADALRRRGGPEAGLVIVPSGGQGPDEPRSEGEAMGEYLVEHGIPAGAVLPETRAATTEQNLRFSRELLGVHRPERTGQLLVVTNGYHVPRTALLSRSLGIDADVIGAPTARYFVPSAFIREFVAVLCMRLRLQITFAVLGVVLASCTGWVVALAHGG